MDKSNNIHSSPLDFQFLPPPTASSSPYPQPFYSSSFCFEPSPPFSLLKSDSEFNNETDLKPKPFNSSAICCTTSSYPPSDFNIGPPPQPLKILQENHPIPPFLSKTYDLVDEPSLDPIISWGSSGRSFVVWDALQFSRIVLPSNFKHSNFSSFARQLNTYGFRKVNSDKWEFANEAFQRGQKHLLKNIQRRRRSHSQQVSYTSTTTHGGGRGAHHGLPSELEKLKMDRTELMQQVAELRRQHQGTSELVAALNQRIQASEQRQKQMVSVLSKVLFGSPQLIKRLRNMRDLGKAVDSSGLGGAGPGIKLLVEHKPWEELRSTRVTTTTATTLVDEEIVKYRSPDYLLEAMVGQWDSSPGALSSITEDGKAKESGASQFGSVEVPEKGKECLGFFPW